MAYQLTADARAIMKALEDPKWDWRTIQGISSDTGLQYQKVADILEGLGAGQLIVVKDTGTRVLYTSRNHYSRQQPFYNRLLSALSDRIK
jgi:hypothetical protein